MLMTMTPLALLPAQTGGEALFLLLPIGAKAVGKGEANVAERGGSEQLWWNPAGIVGAKKPELALHHSQTIVGQGNAMGAVIPFKKFATIGISLNLLDLGSQTSTDEYGQPQGRISTMDIGYSMSIASQVTRFVSIGVTAKHAQARVSCSGLCTDLPTGASGEAGADIGAIVSMGDSVPLTFGMALRHLGIGGDGARPARLDLGAKYDVTSLSRYTDLVKLSTSASIVGTPKMDSIGARLGAEVIVEDWIFVRSGYVFDKVYGSGAAVGFGIRTGRVSFDLARTFGGLSASGEKPPTHFSLRYNW